MTREQRAHMHYGRKPWSVNRPNLTTRSINGHAYCEACGTRTAHPRIITYPGSVERYCPACYRVHLITTEEN